MFRCVRVSMYSFFVFWMKVSEEGAQEVAMLSGPCTPPQPLLWLSRSLQPSSLPCSTATSSTAPRPILSPARPLTKLDEGVRPLHGVHLRPIQPSKLLGQLL